MNGKADISEDRGGEDACQIGAHQQERQDEKYGEQDDRKAVAHGFPLLCQVYPP